ncbi:hypothetical protein ACIBCH_09950 [Amycolatopsis thailandensis]|uniref:hypothetical protein n=1 Tax=Amycolatopsis thailandensis TaxID=589330 RepID=UPI0037A26929
MPPSCFERCPEALTKVVVFYVPPVSGADGFGNCPDLGSFGALLLRVLHSLV